jgi:hypothetical protein
MTDTMEVTYYKHKCKRCAQGWWSKVQEPKYCGICKSPLWNKKKRFNTGPIPHRIWK